MFSARIYTCVCHGCGSFHEIESSFLSSSLLIGFDVEGGSWAVPAHACVECRNEPSVIGPDNRYVGRIRDAFLYGMTPDAYARATRDFHHEWRAKLDARREQR
jgi:hypothetical protein